MEDPANLHNRRAQPPRRSGAAGARDEDELATRQAPGRPSTEDLAGRPPAEPVVPVQVRRVVSEEGIVCPACKQAMKPHVRKAVDGKKYLQCGKCMSELVQDLSKGTVQVLRGVG
jgi:hypothetical protein